MSNTDAYIVRNKCKDVLYKSSSGGFFSALCNYVIKNNGIVFGVAFDNSFTVMHKCAESLSGCRPFVGSKYVQSELNDSFSMVKEYLLDGRLVCFSGTPCQIEGLLKFLGNSYDNLILLDIVCHGVPSNRLWKEYIDYMTTVNDSQIESVSFRSKYYGYQSSVLQISFANGKCYRGSPRTDKMLKTFYSNIALRPSCYTCRFKGTYRCSDFTIWDCWNAANVLAIKDDDQGYSNVLVRGNKAKGIFLNLVEDLSVNEVDVRSILPRNGGMIEHSAAKNNHRFEFNRDFSRFGFINAFENWLTVTYIDEILEKLKPIFRRMKILNVISKRKNIFGLIYKWNILYHMIC